MAFGKILPNYDLSESCMPVGNEGVVVDVPRQSDDRDPCGPRGDDEGGPDAKEDEDESEDYSQGDKDA